MHFMISSCIIFTPIALCIILQYRYMIEASMKHILPVLGFTTLIAACTTTNQTETPFTMPVSNTQATQPIETNTLSGALPSDTNEIEQALADKMAPKDTLIMRN